MPVDVKASRLGAWLFALALLQGLIYCYFVPPWQHYDEPGHFRYAAELAEGGPLSPAFGRLIADSMYRHSFYPPSVQPDLVSSVDVSVGENQRVHAPLYYTIIAALIRPLRGLEVETQLYAARLLSTLLYALSVLAAWRLAQVSAPGESAIHLALPLLVMLSPAFTDLMSAVNNDVLLNFCAFALMLGCALLIRDGLHPAGLALTLLGFAGALLTKRTAMVAAIPCALALLWALRRRPLPWALYAGVIIGLTGAALTLSFTFSAVEQPGGQQLTVTARPWLVALDAAYLRLNVDAWLRSVMQWGLSGHIYREVVLLVFDSFWAHLGWGHIRAGIAVEWAFRIIGVVTALGLARRLVELRAEEPPTWQLRWLIFCLVACGAAWLAVLARVHPLSDAGGMVYLPRGRYMFWALLPTLWLLALGWQGLVPERWRIHTPRVLVGLFVIGQAAAILALSRWYYYPG